MSDDKHHEIVIIKRGGGGHEDGHHGGAWKIAFADFMTAMMAFFLVMWLISASDKTKAVIAHYFNPVQLVDSTPQPKGVQDMKADGQSVMKFNTAQKSDTPAEKDKTSDAKTPTETEANAQNKNSEPDKTAKHEADLFRDPYAVLAEIAAKSDAHPPKVSKKTSTEGDKGGSGAVGLKGGEAFRDPFEPVVLPTTATPPPEDIKAAEAIRDAIRPEPPPPPPPQIKADKDNAKPKDAAKAEAAKAEAAKLEAAKPDAKAEMAKAVAAKADTAAQEAQAAAIRAKIEAMKEPAPAAGAPATPEPKIDVHRTAEGLVIGLTDDATFAMFASASAEPSPKMVQLMEKIGRLLKSEKGGVTIRGFTDNRPFKSDTYDNWRLSTARADMAHYMLVRGGLDEARIDRIEGYADRRPKNPKDPGSPENRRIEILLREPTP